VVDFFHAGAWNQIAYQLLAKLEGLQYHQESPLNSRARFV
jgi:hypothetical protein